MRNEMPQPSDRQVRAVAEAVRLPPSRVRHYVRIGLVRPSRTEGRVVFFEEAELARLRRIRRLQEDLGLNLAGVEVAMQLLDEIHALRAARRQETG